MGGTCRTSCRDCCVIPAKAGIQFPFDSQNERSLDAVWIPAFAGMTGEVRACAARLGLAAGTDRGTKGRAGDS